jgi:hypothetical protein
VRRLSAVSELRRIYWPRKSRTSTSSTSILGPIVDNTNGNSFTCLSIKQRCSASCHLLRIGSQPSSSFTHNTAMLFHIVHVLVACLSLASSQSACYYPNGGITTGGDQPCVTGEHSLCCPFQWQCLSNGLCYDPTAQYYGRYTCTDRTWQPDNCPNICTFSMYL